MCQLGFEAAAAHPIAALSFDRRAQAVTVTDPQLPKQPELADVPRNPTLTSAFRRRSRKDPGLRHRGDGGDEGDRVFCLFRLLATDGGGALTPRGAGDFPESANTLAATGD
jgi:hypothetical protein